MKTKRNEKEKKGKFSGAKERHLKIRGEMDFRERGEIFFLFT